MFKIRTARMPGYTEGTFRVSLEGGPFHGEKMYLTHGKTLTFTVRGKTGFYDQAVIQAPAKWNQV